MSKDIIILDPNSITPEDEREWMRKPNILPKNAFVIVGSKLMNARIVYGTMGKMLRDPIEEDA